MRLLENARRGPWWTKVLGLVLVPVLIAAGLLGATWSSDSRLHRVEAAVVNLDEAVTVNDQLVPLGRQLTAELVDSDKEQNFRWVLANEKAAREGMKSGRFAAVVTIPKTFSKAATSFGRAAGEAEQATIRVETSPQAGIADTALGQAVAQAAAQALNRTLTQTYLENIYLGFNEMGKQFQTVADAASQLADGQQKLTDGLGQARDGSNQLSTGLETAYGNGPALRSGGTQLVGGVKQYTDGIGQAASGAQKLTDGLGQISAGSPQLRSGGTQLASGASGLASGAYALRDGLVPYTQGTTQLATSTSQQLDMLIQLRILLDKIQATQGGADQTQVVPQLQVAIAALQQQVATSQTTAKQLSAQVGGLQTQITTGLDQTAKQVAAQCPPQVQQLGPEACQGYVAGVMAMTQAGKQTVAQVFSTPDPATGRTLQQSLQQLSAALGAIDDASLRDILAQVNVVLGMTQQMLAQGGQLPSVADMQAQKGQLAQLAGAGPALVSGATQLGDGAKQLSGGVSQYANGVAQYTGGVDQVAAGAGQLSSGLTTAAAAGPQLVSGVQAYTDGVGQLVDGIGQAAAGSRALTDGLAQTTDGSKQLADGTRQLADGLKKGATQIPSYTDAERTQLATVVASPISVSDLDGLVTPAAAWASLLMVLALWVGALATYLVLPALRSRLALSSRGAAALVGESLLPGLAVVGIQAVAVAALGQLFLHLPAVRWFGLLGVLLLAGVAFVAVNHALAAWLGGAGRVVAVLMATLTVATAVTAAAPAFFDSIRPLSPVSPALDAVRTVVAGGTGVTGSVFVLIGWALIAAVLTTAAVLKARTVSPKMLLAAA